MKKYSFIPLAVALSLAACSSEPSATESVSNVVAEDALQMTVYKSPTCGCCGAWVEHVEDSGVKVEVSHPDDLNAVKAKYKVPQDHGSCHTAVTAEGDVFEGHVPHKFIAQFLADRPEGAFGLAVPAMPIGTPGMEMGEKFSPYEVRLLMKDGSTKTYAKVSSAAEQF